MTGEDNTLDRFVSEYSAYLDASFEELWSKVPVDPRALDAFSVIGGLLARQVTLTRELSRAPSLWNGHSAPLFLRAMTDLQIALAWILIDPAPRSEKYILHGLGEAKLLMEQYAVESENATDQELKESTKQISDVHRHWIQSQRNEYLVEVNLGNWAQLDYRTMAQEAGIESLYKFAYRPFSQVAHNMWPHVSIYNCVPCENPLHRHHLVPSISDAPQDTDFMFRSCKYLHRSYESMVDRFDIDLEAPMPLDWWENFVGSLRGESPEEEANQQP